MPWAKPNWRPSLPITAERGYLILAVDREGTDYVTCAQRLADSIRSWHPAAETTVITATDLPYGDQGGYANDWQCWHVSPYRQTIKLEADMLAVGPIDHWWTLFEHRDVVISQGARDFYGRLTAYRGYRKIFDDNHLPDVYNAITYWRVSATAQEFWRLVREIFHHWPAYRTLLRFPEDLPSTDVVYAMAAVIMGTNRVTLPERMGPAITHMKPGINPLRGQCWTQELIWETDPPRINTVAQWGLLHYHVKDWCPDE
jgi:hypothetical protein